MVNKKDLKHLNVYPRFRYNSKMG